MNKLKYILIPAVVLLFILVGGISIASIFDMSGNARVVNYAGIVRGGSQKLIKEELSSAYTKDLTKQDDALIARLDGIIYGLSYGEAIDAERDFSLIALNDAVFMADMGEIREFWEKLKEEIMEVRAGKDPQMLYELSQEYFQLCDKTVGDGESFEDKHKVEFCVEDTGIGMTQEQISKLFVAFQQANVRTSIKYGGTGLGLAISRNLVRNMGGDIVVESEYGQGSRFSFALKFDVSATSGTSENDLACILSTYIS